MVMFLNETLEKWKSLGFEKHTDYDCISLSMEIALGDTIEIQVWSTGVAVINPYDKNSISLDPVEFDLIEDFIARLEAV